MDLTNNKTYIQSCKEICSEKLSKYKDIKEISIAENDVNAYDHLDTIEAPREVFILDHVTDKELQRARICVLEGRFFSEHAAAGEATRLGLGTKYLINIKESMSAARIAKLIGEEKGTFVSEDDVAREAECRPSELLSISVGTRHMIQFSFDIVRLANEEGFDPKLALANQKMLIILNETTYEKILEEFQQHNFFGFERVNVMFMIQKSYHGFNDKFEYDTSSPKRLHNHGQMVMQETMDDEVFYLDESGKWIYLKSEQYGEILKTMDDKLSYNIEDVRFYIGAIDYKSLAMTLTMMDQGYRMVMEIVANNPDNPQKGGMAAYDRKLKRNVMIEAFELKGIANADIKFLNKNFNHYPKPFESWHEMKIHGLKMPIDIKNKHIYFQPIQGDINYLVKTEFVQRKVLKPIQSWKTPGTTPLTMYYMHKQDLQDGFVDYCKKFKII